MSFVAVGVSAGVGVGEAAIGLINKGKADKRAKELAATRPKLQTSPYLKDQLALEESDLSTGMSAGAKSAYEDDMDRSLSTSLGTITRMGGSPNNVGDVFAGSANGRARLAIMKDNMRLQKIQALGQARGASEEERQKEFEFNQWAPWADATQANAAAKASANSEIFSGINTAAGGVMRYGQSVTQANQFKDALKAKYGAGGGTSVNTNANANATAEPTASPTPTLDGLMDPDQIIY